MRESSITKIFESWQDSKILRHSQTRTKLYMMAHSSRNGHHYPSDGHWEHYLQTDYGFPVIFSVTARRFLSKARDVSSYQRRYR